MFRLLCSHHIVFPCSNKQRMSHAQRPYGQAQYKQARRKALTNMFLFLTEIFTDLIELTSDLEQNKGTFYLDTLTKYLGTQFRDAVGPTIQHILQERPLARAQVNNDNESYLSDDEI